MRVSNAPAGATASRLRGEDVMKLGITGLIVVAMLVSTTVTGVGVVLSALLVRHDLAMVMLIDQISIFAGLLACLFTLLLLLRKRNKELAKATKQAEHLASAAGNRRNSLTVHYLIAGLALCGAGAPNEWPDGDLWVGPGNGKSEDVTCPECQEALAEPEDESIYVQVWAVSPKPRP